MPVRLKSDFTLASVTTTFARRRTSIIVISSMSSKPSAAITNAVTSYCS